MADKKVVLGLSVLFSILLALGSAELSAQAEPGGSWRGEAGVRPELPRGVGAVIAAAAADAVAPSPVVEPGRAPFGLILGGTATGTVLGATLGYYAGRAVARDRDNLNDSWIGPTEPLVGGLLGGVGGAWLGARVSNSWRGNGSLTALGVVTGLAAGVAVGSLLESTSAGVVVGIGLPAYAEWASSR